MMVKLIFRILIFTGIILLLSFSALHINPNYKKEYVAGIIPKLKKLKATKTKKIVIIGGSNATFGIDTDLMEQQLSIPVVNMSLHGGLPLKYIMEQVKFHMNKGDILILSKEYEGLKDQYWNTMRGIELPKVAIYDLSQIYVLFSDRKLFESTIPGIFRTIEHYITRYPIEARKELNSVYDSRAFQGDNLMSELMVGSYEKEIESHPLHTPHKKSLVSIELNKYKEYFDSKGISFYLTPPVIVKGFYEDENITPFWKLFSESTGIPMLNNEKKYTYDKEYFFNSHYHTNHKGRKIRTESLIDDIVIMKLIPLTK